MNKSRFKHIIREGERPGIAEYILFILFIILVLIRLIQVIP